MPHLSYMWAFVPSLSGGSILVPVCDLEHNLLREMARCNVQQETVLHDSGEVTYSWIVVLIDTEVITLPKGMSLQFCSRLYNCKCWNEVLICSGSVVLLDACVSYIRFHYDFVHYCLIIWLYSHAGSFLHAYREVWAYCYRLHTPVPYFWLYVVHNSQHTRWCDMPSCALGNGMNLRWFALN